MHWLSPRPIQRIQVIRYCRSEAVMIERMCARRLRALVDASGGAWRFAFAILQLIIFSMMLVQVFMVQDGRLNGFLRAGTAVYCVVNAAFPLFPLHGPVAQLLKISPMRSLQMRMTGWGIARVDLRGAGCETHCWRVRVCICRTLLRMGVPVDWPNDRARTATFVGTITLRNDRLIATVRAQNSWRWRWYREESDGLVAPQQLLR